MKTIQHCFDYVRHHLGNLYSPSEVRQIAFALVGEAASLSLAEMLINKDTKLSDIQVKKIESFTNRMQNGEPLQYILGSTDFCGLHFEVNQNTLIPRPETSELVDWIVRENKLPNPQIIDIGTGSGCIAISLKSMISSAEITAIDISCEALEVARRNAERNAASIRFIAADILNESEKIGGTYDIIVSNPPYIRECEKGQMERNVVDYEPHKALFVPDGKPLLFYEVISRFGTERLNPNGRIFFEINQLFGREVCDMLKYLGYKDIELKKDFYQNDRMVCATLYKSQQN
jgi:release factor glutamine methyltransferase